MDKKFNRLMSIILLFCILISYTPSIVFANSNGLMVDVDKELGEYKNKFESKKEDYTYLDFLSLKSLDKKPLIEDDKFNFSDLDFKEDQKSKNNAGDYAEAIMSIIALDKDPRNYKGRNFVKFLVASQDDEGRFIVNKDESSSAETIALSILALDMAGADYNRKLSVDNLKDRFTIEDEMMYIKKYSFDNSGDIKETGLATLALSETDFIKENLEKIISFFNSEKISNGMIGTTIGLFNEEEESARDTALVIQNLIALGQEVPEEMIKGLLELKDNFGFRENEKVPTEYSTSEVIAAFVDYKNKSSMYKEIFLYDEKPVDLEINFSDLREENRVKDGESFQLCLKAFDKNGLVIKDFESSFKSNNEDIIRIDKDGRALALKPGKAEIKATSSNIEEKIEIEVLPVEIKSIEIEIEDDLKESLVGKNIFLKAYALDEDGDRFEKTQIDWEFSQKDLVSYREVDKIMTTKKPGNLKIKAYLRENPSIFNEIDFKILDRKDLYKDSLTLVESGIVNEGEKYNYLLSMALNAMGRDRTEIASNIKLNGQYGFLNTEGIAENIMTALAIGEDPEDFRGKDYIVALKEKDLKSEKNNVFIKSLLALELSQTEYDREDLINDLLSRLKVEGDKKYLIYENNGKFDCQNTALSLIVLNENKNIDSVESSMEAIKKKLKSEQADSALIGNTKEHSTIVQALIAINEDIYSDYWTKKDKMGNEIDLGEALLKMQIGEKFKLNEDSKWPGNDVENFAYPALVDLYRGRSMYKDLMGSKFDSYHIEIENKEKSIKQGETIFLNAKTFKNGKKEDLELVWEVDSEGLVSIEGNKLSALKPGKVNITAHIKGFPDSRSSFNLEIIEFLGEPTSVLIVNKPSGPLAVGENISLTAEVLDQFGNILEGQDLIWKISNDDIASLDQSGRLKVLKTGRADIEVSIKGNDIKDGFNLTVLSSEDDKFRTIDSVIDIVGKYYNTIHFRENNGTLNGGEIAAFKKAGLDIDNGWYLDKDLNPRYDSNLKYLGNKADQALNMIDQGRDPRNYKGRDLIGEIQSEINKEDYGHADSKYLRGVIAVNEYNRKFADKINYDSNTVLKNIKLAQESDGGFKERKGSVLPNTGYALQALAGIDGGDEKDLILEKTLTYLLNNQKEDGAFYLKTYNTNNNIEVIKGLLAIDEDLTSDKWTINGNNPIDSIFLLYRGDGSFDAIEGESINNRGWISATENVLYTFGLLKENGYGDYVVENIKSQEPIEEKEVTVSVAIISLSKDGGADVLYEPREIKVNNTKNHKGLTALGALEEVTKLYTMSGSMVTSIYGLENKGMGGWMYTVNDNLSNNMAGQHEILEGDRILWFYDLNGMAGRSPKWDDIFSDSNTEEPKEAEVNINFIKNKDMENGREVVFEIDSEDTNKPYKCGLFNMKTNEIVNFISVDSLSESSQYRFLIPDSGSYEIRLIK